MSRRKNYKSRRRYNLYQQSPYCHWCGNEVILNYNKNGTLPDNAATLDHLRDKTHPFRGQDSEPNTVLACYKCNHSRGATPKLRRGHLHTFDKRLREIHNAHRKIHAPQYGITK